MGYRIHIILIGCVMLFACSEKKPSGNSAVAQASTSEKSETTVISQGKNVNEDGTITERFQPAEGSEGGYTIQRYKNIDTTLLNDPRTRMSFSRIEHDFGDIDQHTSNETIFKFKNEGAEPLIIYDGKGSCGCTVPEYPKHPIMPGEESEIKIVYKPGTQYGNHKKTVTLTANTTPMKSILTIKANVHKVGG